MNDIQMTTKERFTRMSEHRAADRVSIADVPWDATIARWRSEGMPEGMDFEDFFGIDRVDLLFVDGSPQYEKRTLEETDE
jgi:uroporphyrinogen decarboxylase